MKRYLGSFANSESMVQVAKVGIIGVVNTVVSLVLLKVFLLLTGGAAERSDGFDMRVFIATAAAFILTTALSYVLNRRWTFALDDATGDTMETSKFFLINGVALALTQVIVQAANFIWGPLSDRGVMIAYIAAAGLIILPKFAGYRDVVFKKAVGESRAAQESDPVAG